MVTKVKDEKQVMSPYLAHKVRNKTRYLELKISSKHTNDIFENVTYNVYADLEMKTLIESKELEIKDVNDVYVAEVKLIHQMWITHMLLIGNLKKQSWKISFVIYDKGSGGEYYGRWLT